MLLNTVVAAVQDRALRKAIIVRNASWAFGDEIKESMSGMPEPEASEIAWEWPGSRQWRACHRVGQKRWAEAR